MKPSASSFGITTSSLSFRWPCFHAGNCSSHSMVGREAPCVRPVYSDTSSIAGTTYAVAYWDVTLRTCLFQYVHYSHMASVFVYSQYHFGTHFASSDTFSSCFVRSPDSCLDVRAHSKTIYLLAIVGYVARARHPILCLHLHSEHSGCSECSIACCINCRISNTSQIIIWLHLNGEQNQFARRS